MTVVTSTDSLREDATVIGLVSTAHGLSHFCQLILPPLFPWLAPAFGLSNTQLGLLMTVFYAVSFVGQAAAGFVVDRFGAQRVLLAGLSLLALAALGMSMAPGYAALLACMALAGLGNCVFHPVDFSILNARVSTPRLGHAYAAHGISGSLGWALAPLFVVGIAQAAGWRQALAAVALLVAAVLAVMTWQRAPLDGRSAAKAVAGTKAAAAASPGLGFLKSAAVWSCFGFFLTAAVALGAVQSFAPAAAGRLHGVPAAQAALALSVYMLASAAGMVLGGHLVRQPERSAAIVAGGVGVGALAALLLAFGHWQATGVLLLFGLMGFGVGTAGPSRDWLVKQATPAGATGRVYGVVYSGLDIGTSIAPLVFGALMDAGRHQGVLIGLALAQGLLIASAFNVRWRSRPALATN
jgi:MFS family permease